MTPTQIADEAIGLFLEYRDTHGKDEDVARVAAVAEVAEGASVIMPEEEAAWRLREAAPDLLAACEALLKGGECSCRDREDILAGHPCEICIGEAAIAKAKGTL